MSAERSLEGRSALITGGTSGIGRATAIRFAREGATVTAVGRSESGLVATEKAVGEIGGRCETVVADLHEDDARERAVAAHLAAFGRLDVLVNAAGVIGSGSLADTSLEDWEAMMRLNVDAVFRLMQLALPSLREHGGCVVNVSSVTGLRSFPGILAYCVSKAAVDQLTRCAALELADSGVRVNAVNPGVVQTELHRRAGMDDEQYAAFLEHSRDTHPLGRVGSPDEVAAAILFLASGESGWITGETLSIDGGRHLTCAR